MMIGFCQQWIKIFGCAELQSRSRNIIFTIKHPIHPSVYHTTLTVNRDTRGTRSSQQHNQTKQSSIRSINSIFAEHRNLLKESPPFKRITLNLQELDLEETLGDTLDDYLSLESAHPGVARENPNHGVHIAGLDGWYGWDRNAETVESLADERDEEF